MIKANELRIGNWFMSAKHDVPFQWQASDFAEAYNTEANPIPLTPEILEKAGFELYQDAFCYNDFRLRKRYLTPEKKEYKLVFHPFIDFIGGDRQIKYVHQLQNLYWCLCGEELNIQL